MTGDHPGRTRPGPARRARRRRPTAGRSRLRPRSRRTRSGCGSTSTPESVLVLTEFAGAARRGRGSSRPRTWPTRSPASSTSTPGVLPPDTLWWAGPRAGCASPSGGSRGSGPCACAGRYDAPPAAAAPADAGAGVRLPAGAAGPLRLRRPTRPRGPDDQLFHCPDLQRVRVGPRLPGLARLPGRPGRVPEEFFRCYFSATGDTARGKSRRHPRDIGALWAELDGQARLPGGRPRAAAAGRRRAADRDVSARALVEYLVARDGRCRRAAGLAYDYVVAGDGLYVVADNRYLAVRVPVARAACAASLPSTRR